MRVSVAPASLDLVQAKNADPVSVGHAAKKLEGAFAELLIGAMRKAAPDDSLFPGAAGHYRDLYDRQLAELLVRGQGLGLQASIRARLSGQSEPVAVSGGSVDKAIETYSLAGYRRPASVLARAESETSRPPAIDDWRAFARPADPASAASVSASTTPKAEFSPPVARAAGREADPPTPERFVAEIWPHARRAAAELGVPARMLVAQAALESGWGRSRMRGNDGEPAHNLFGIKTGGRWQGRVASHATVEFENGAARDQRADFRAYASTAESFADYVRLLKNSPRYADAVASGGDGRRFAEALARAGYATDPRYAEKLTAIAEGPTLRRALAMAGVETEV